jgi:hypothetical protein
MTTGEGYNKLLWFEKAIQRGIVKHPEGDFVVEKYWTANNHETMFAVGYINREGKKQMLGRDLTLDEAIALVRIASVQE